MIKQIVFIGDSLTVGFQLLGVSIGQGGKGGWVELAAELLNDAPTVGPLLGTGIRPVSGGWVSLTEWSFAGSWTAVTNSNAFDKMPYNSIKYANGATNIATFTVSTHWRPAVGFCIYYIDYASGGNWQYRINGGSWTNMGQTILNDDKLAKFYVASAVSPGQTIDIRGFDGTADCGVLPAGIELFYSDPRVATQGLIVHNLAVGGTFMSQLFPSAPADPLAFFDSVKLGTGSPITNSPNSGTFIMHINDVVFNNVGQWATNHTSFYNRVSPLGPVGFISPWENGAGPSSFVTKVTNYTVLTSDNVFGFNFNGTSLTATLPATPPAPGLISWYVIIINLNASALTINPNSNTLTGSSTVAQNQVVQITSNGTKYTVSTNGAYNQANFRASTKSSAQSLGAQIFDIYDAWNANGWGNVVGTQSAALIAQGFTIPDDSGTHPTQAAHLDLAVRIYWFLRNQILGISNEPAAYSVGAKQVASSYTGSKPAVAYTSSLPISLLPLDH